MYRPSSKSTKSKKSKKSSKSHGSEYVLDVDEFINRLLQTKDLGERFHLTEKECQAVAVVIRAEFIQSSICIEVDAPIKICGDIHGQYADLLRIFDLCGYPPYSRYLFLGDYVDRGRRGLEVLMLLFLLKIKYPTSIYLLRGNHESEKISRVYGFRQEIKERFNSSKLWKTLTKTFQLMPLCAVVEKSIFCCHGGLSPVFLKDRFNSLNEVFENYHLPCEVESEGLLCDLMWADPLDAIGDFDPQGWVANKRGCSWSFGYDVIYAFLNKFNLDLIVRGHQVVEDGYEFYCNRMLVTLFSAPRYCGEFDNAGGIFVIDKIILSDGSALEGAFKIVPPDYNSPHQWFRNLKPKH